MLAINGNARFFLYGEPVSMHKSFEGLCSVVEQALKEEPVCGAYFIFLNRQKDKMKVLYWDSDGLAIWYKRLERGSFLCKGSGKINLNRRDFLMLLEGVVPKRFCMRHNI